MKVRKQWRKPYQRVREDGIIPTAFVAYRKYDYQKGFDITAGKIVTNKWAHTLYLDLIIVKLRLCWFTDNGQQEQ